jgi:cell wall-associated NlpC family hydrolase
VRRPRLRGRRRQAPLFVGLLATAGLVVVGGATAQPGGNSIDSKKAEAQQVLAQIAAMDAQLEVRIQKYDQATYKLAKIQKQLKTSRQELTYAHTSLVHAQKTLQQRAVALYTAPQDDSTVSVILGATSLDDLMSRLDTAKRVSRQDAQTVSTVTQFRDLVARHTKVLAKATVQQQQEVARQAAERGTVQRQLAERQSYLSHVKGQIRDLIAQQQAAQRAASQRAAAIAAARLAAATPSPTPSLDSSTSTATVVDSGGGSVASSGHGTQVAQIALAQQGKPYVWAAAGPNDFDCSGLVVYVFAQIGISLPHSSYSLAGMGQPVDRADLEPGDLVFFNGDSHVGIYIGGGQMVHAPHTGDVVRVISIDEHGGYGHARRI